MKEPERLKLLRHPALNTLALSWFNLQKSWRLLGDWGNLRSWWNLWSTSSFYTLSIFLLDSHSRDLQHCLNSVVVTFSIQFSWIVLNWPSPLEWNKCQNKGTSVRIWEFIAKSMWQFSTTKKSASFKLLEMWIILSMKAFFWDGRYILRTQGSGRKMKYSRCFKFL
jgi:hypothetical protein